MAQAQDMGGGFFGQDATRQDQESQLIRSRTLMNMLTRVLATLNSDNLLAVSI